MNSISNSFQSDEICKAVTSYLINRATNENGFLATKIDVKNDAIKDRHHNAGELGDYAQYIAFSGKLLGKTEYIDYAINQVKLLSIKYQRKDGIIDLEPSKRILNIGEMDLYIGMAQLFFITQDSFIKDVIDKFYDGLFNKFLKGKRLVPTKLTKSLKFIIPVANPMDNGNHIELLGELYKFTEEEKYKRWMIQLSEIWIDNKNFIRHNLYERENINFLGKVLSSTIDILLQTSYFKNKFGKPSYCSKITKQNTHLMFGLIEYYNITKDVKIKEIFDKWVQKVDELFLHSSGIHYGIYDLKYKYPYRLEVLHTINLIELMITAYQYFNKNKYLNLAEKYAKALINILTQDNLLLLFPFPKDDINDPQRDKMKKEYGYYSLDPQIDFSVNLLKLYLITKNDHYFKVAENILIATLTNFKHGNCYTEMVHKDTDKKWDVVRTKYLGLMLKPFLMLLALEEGYSPNNFGIQLILQDR